MIRLLPLPSLIPLFSSLPSLLPSLCGFLSAPDESSFYCLENSAGLLCVFRIPFPFSCCRSFLLPSPKFRLSSPPLPSITALCSSSSYPPQFVNTSAFVYLPYITCLCHQTVSTVRAGTVSAFITPVPSNTSINVCQQNDTYI